MKAFLVFAGALAINESLNFAEKPIVIDVVRQRYTTPGFTHSTQECIVNIHLHDKRIDGQIEMESELCFGIGLDNKKKYKN